MTLDSRPSDTFRPGDLLNNTYRIVGIIGRGGTSEVYLGKSEISGRVVALKVLNAELSKDAENLLLMTREEEIRDVRHDAVVRYSENNRTPDNHVYLVMDYVEGPRLDQVMAERDLSVDELLAIARRVAEGLVATHARKIIHRDLSPDNIILRGGKADEAVIIDFGIARDETAGAATIVGDGFAGKYAYAAPEQLRGESDGRSDLYSLGALLLAAYRGKPLSAGASLMEILESKKAPLDTAGVPEPLRTIIDRLTAPDPMDRPATAEEALALIDPGRETRQPDQGPTIIGVGSDLPPRAEATNGAGGSARMLLRVGLFVVLLGAAGAGAYFSGLGDRFLGPSYPVASPYTLDVVKRPNARMDLTGYAPSEAAREQFETVLRDNGGTATVELASGELPPDWAAGVLELIGRLSVLDDWRISFDGGTFDAEGVASSVSDRELMATSFAPGNLPEGFRGKASFVVGPRDLPVENVREVLEAVADCGPLRLVDPPPDKYALNERIIVEGSLASSRSADVLYAALADTAGDRPIVLDTDVLNEALCAVETRLGALVERVEGVTTYGPGQRPVILTEGISGEPRPDGKFREGENPIIDLQLPPGMNEGHLWVTIIDVNGNAFHLLPNLRNPVSDVATIRATSGPMLRLSYPLGTPDRLAFQVDDTSGTSKILVFHSSAPLFEATRPTTESIAGFAEALEKRIAAGGLNVYSLTEEFIVTE